MNENTYPKPIVYYYTKNYPDENYKIWSSTDGNGNMIFYSKLKSDSTIWFDKHGKYTSTQISRNKTTAQNKNARSNKENHSKNNASASKKSVTLK